MYGFYEIVEIWDVDFFWRVVVGVLIFEKIGIFCCGVGGEYYFCKVSVELFIFLFIFILMLKVIFEVLHHC